MKAPFYILLLIVLLTPWLNGGADLPTRPYIYGLLLVAFAATTFDLLKEKRLPSVHAPVLITIAAMALGAMSLVPVSTTRFPAKSLELWAKLTGAEFATLSLNPSETRIQLSMLCAITTAIFVASQIRLDEFKLRFLSCAMLANGVALTLFAFVQRYSWNGRLFWVFDLPVNETTFGPMVYHNVAGNYLAVCLAVGSYIVAKTVSHKRSISEIDAGSTAAVLMLAIVAVGLLCSLSRGAILSSLMAFTVVAYLFASRMWNPYKMIWLLPFVACFAGTMLWFGMSDTVVDRLDTITSGDILTDQRLIHWQAASRAAKDFWGMGCGAGAYGRVVATYEQSNAVQAVFNNAHNQYLEFVIVAGVSGLALFLLLIWNSLVHCMKLTKHAEQNLAFFGFLSTFVVLYQCFHASVDFCLMILCVSLPVACIVGLAVGQQTPRPRAGLLSRILPIGFWSLILLGMTWATFDASTAGQVDLALRKLPWGTNQSQMSERLLASRLTDIQRAVSWRTDSMEGQEALALLHTISYRVRAREQIAIETEINKNDPNLWQWTSPEVIHHRIHTLRRDGNIETVNQLRHEPLMERHLGPAREALLKSRSACPLWANVHLRLEELSFLAPNASMESNVNAQRIRQIAGSDARILFECGNREFGAGRYDSAYESWRQSLTISVRYINDIVRLASSHLDTAGIMQKVVPADDPAALVHMMDSFEDDKSVDLDQTIVAKHALRLLKEPVDIPPVAEDWFVQSRLAGILEKPIQRITYLDKAVKLKPFMTRWRFELAKQLAEDGQLHAAESQAIRCARQKTWRIYREFLDDLRFQIRKKNTVEDEKTPEDL